MIQHHAGPIAVCRIRGGMMSEEVVQVYKYTSYGDIHYENYSDAIVVKQESCMQINGRF